MNLNSLVIACWLVGGLTLATGIALRKKDAFAQWMRTMPRSETWAAIFFGCGLVWFLWKVLHLGEADFGNFRHIFFLLFGAAGLGAFVFMPDFLAVRGMALLILLAGNDVLQAAFLQEPRARLFLVSWTYILIVAAIWLGATPWRFPRWVTAILATGHSRGLAASVLTAIGAGILLSSFACL